MKYSPWFICGAIWLTAFSNAAPPVASLHARQSPAPGASALGAALAGAYDRAVQAREARGISRHAEAEQTLARGLWPEQPSVELAYENGAEGTRETEVSVNMPLWLPGQRSAAQASAQSEIDYGAAFERAAKLKIAGEVREAAWAVRGADAELEAGDAQLQALKRLLDDVERRVKAGELARVDGLTVRSEWLAGLAHRAELLQRSEAVRLRWTTLTGLPPLSGDWQDAAMPGADDRHPELELARLDVFRARARLHSVRLQGRAPPELSLSYRHEAAGAAAETTHSLGVGIRIPFGSTAQNGPQEAAALTELEVAQAQLARIESGMNADRASAQAAARLADEQLRLVEERASLLRERAALYEKSFQAGETGLPELLRALDAAAQARSDLVRQQLALGLATSRLVQLSGTLP